jgi:hypothetical protein
MIHIKVPIWNGRKGKEAIGIAEDLLHEGLNEISIDYTNKYGEKVFPHKYAFLSRTALDCKGGYATQEIKGRKIRIIPIKDLLVGYTGKDM